MSGKGSGMYTGDKDFDELLDKCLRIMKTKAVDYAEGGDRLAELRATAKAVGADMRQVLGVYMNKHYRSIFKWLRGEELLGEPIEEKLLDNIVYSLLAFKLAKELREKSNRFPEPQQAHADIGIVICDLCAREMTLAKSLDSKLTPEEWRREVGDSPFICNICMNDPNQLSRAPQSIQSAVQDFMRKVRGGQEA